ncbi:hypothetical protein BAUCODRAFT_229717 [Baudoinia panamericana UAMH 10762]|uniref:Uncharacterized protein n=1 Tax=Baudoinia panamericana (strain UAMH 10762) TaxID=717646 RepID=M2N2G6_BAUPA|nr:uncharacterized protein BAUCODRAFT_229717 [Baudoinia panamericana UAMH 10762]EMC93174.1 hypothetical protein BAUCODRAFT_229717 [Baudoinia panamericana UAMH 10762]
MLSRHGVDMHVMTGRLLSIPVRIESLHVMFEKGLQSWSKFSKAACVHSNKTEPECNSGQLEQ